ncbi:hypothetical protein CN152_35745 [Sinorhizobium meliloti]|nr:hypothetical protein CN152_35745 [Sinorhizobium meliloti]RVN33699.1 hypothetical protein CN113_35740 [Sinorhizobium meliloti]
MAWPPTTATKREVNMGENGMIGWPENSVLVHAAIFIRPGPGNGDRMVASKHGLVRDFGALPALLNSPLNREVSAFDLRIQP